MRLPLIKVNRLLESKEKKQAMWVLSVITLVALLELFGVASLVPLISSLSGIEAIESNAFTAFLYRYMNEPEPKIFVQILGGIFISIILLTSTIKAYAQYLQIKFTKMRVHSIGQRMLELYLGKDYLWYGEQNTAKLSSKILNEVNQTVSQTIFPLLQIFAHSTVAILIFVFLIVLSPALAFSTLAFLISIYAIVYLLLRKPLSIKGAARVDSNARRYRIIYEIFGGIKDIKIKRIEQNMVNLFIPPSLETVKNEAAIDVMKQAPGIIMQGVVSCGAIAVLLILSNGNGGMAAALPTFGAFAYAGYKLMPSLQQIFRNITSVRSSEAALDTLLKDFKSGMRLASTTSKKLDKVFQFHKNIAFENASFRYPNSASFALKNLNITLEKNSSIGIVGPSGSGKTTLVDILLGLIPLKNGRLVIDNKPLNEIDRQQWAGAIGYVPQAIFIADDTLAANIAFGVPKHEIDFVKVKSAAKLAELHDFIISSLSEGYQTHVGERGAKLSGGQKQRVGIARALYHNPSILVLDEATSALDNYTERAIMRSISKLSSDKTIIMIAHRISTIENCDQIILIKDGKREATGTYDELLQSSEEFKKLAQTSSE